MDVGQSLLPDSINPNNFPAKLWRLVNNPSNRAISWDSHGDVIIIDQQLFERQILTPSPTKPDHADGFKTTNFSSFVRQLNLYGFRKADPTTKNAGDGGGRHRFYNPNFRRNHPELVARLRRLTVDNKAKLQAGLKVNCRPPSRYELLVRVDGGRDKNVKRGSSSLLSPNHRESAHPYCPTKSTTVHNGTPVPPRYLMRGHAAAPGIPGSLIQHYPAVSSSSSALHIHQGLLASANPYFTSFNSCNAQYHPSFCSAVCHSYHPNLVTGSGLQTGLLSPQSYYQAGYSVNMLCHEDHNQDLQNKETQEMKKCDVNLDTVFQIADEVMQTPPSNCLVKAVTPEKPGPMLELSSNACNATLCDSPSNAIKANPLCATSIIVAVSGTVDLATCRQQEESVVKVPEQMPEDAIAEVTSDEARDTEVIDVIFSDTHTDPSQVYSSSCTRSSANV